MHKDILQDAMQLSANLNLYSKEVFSLQEIVDLIDAFNMNNVRTKENISKLISFYNLQSFYINKQILINALQKLNSFIFKTIGKE